MDRQQGSGGLALDVLLPPSAHAAKVVDEVSAGLRRARARLPLAELADSRTRALWAEVDDAESYYPLRCTRALASTHAAHIAELARPGSLVVVGGADVQTVATLAEAARKVGLVEIVVVGPVAPRVTTTCEALAEAVEPTTQVRGVVADPTSQLLHVAFVRPGLLLVSGPTLGRFDGPERARFLAGLRHASRPGDAVLLGVDLTSDRERAIAAYDDPHGLHGERARNALAVLAREFAAQVDPAGWEPVVTWDERGRAVEVDLRARSPQHIAIPSIDVDRWFEPDEVIEVERNATFLRNGIDAQLALAGLQVSHWLGSASDDYAFVLATP